jgi:DNA-binding response OmpR family regulator
MSNRVLVVDGDVRSLRVLEISLRGAGFDVDLATTGLEAWDKLQASPSDLPDLVLADTELDGIDGFELCSRTRKTSQGATVPFLLLAADQSLERKIRALEAGADDYLVKPVFIKEVLVRIRARLQRRERDRLISGSLAGDRAADKSEVGDVAGALSGDLTDITVLDLIQLAEDKRRSGIIHLRGETGTPGSIFVRQGKVVDAEVGQLSGIDALSRLFAWTAGTFQLEWKSIRRRDAMDRASGSVIIEGLQKLDERNRLTATFPDPSVVFEVNYRLLAERLAEIPDVMNSVLRLCDGVRTLAQLLEDCPLPDVEALTALIRLREEGIIFDRGQHAPGPPAGGSGPFDSSGANGDTAAMTSSDRAWSSEAGSEVSAAVRRRTAHGLGHAAPLSLQLATNSAATDLAFAPAEAPQANAEPRRDNLIPFPRSDEASPGASNGVGDAEDDVVPSLLTDSLPPHLQALHRQVPNHHLVIGQGERQEAGQQEGQQEDARERGDDAGSPSEPSDSAIPSAAGTSHRLGGRILGAGALTDTAVPREVIDRRSSGARETSGLYRTYDTKVSASDSGGAAAQQTETEDGVPALALSVEVTPSLGARTTDKRASPNGASSLVRSSSDRSGSRRDPASVRVKAGADVTERIRHHEDEISPSDAHVELGLPSRWRGARFFVVAVVAGGLAAIVAHRIRSVSQSEQPAGAPDQIHALNGQGQGDTAAQPASPSGAPAGPVAAAATVKSIPPPPSATPPIVDLPAPVPVPPGAAAATATTAEAATTPIPRTGSAATPRGGPVVVPATAMPSPEPEYPDPAQLLATCRTAFARNRQQEALSACGTAVAANPRSAEALTMLAHAELNRGRLSRAGELADKALALDPGIADAYVIAGGVHQDSGRNSEAKAAYRRYLELPPHGRYADELRSIVNSL